MKAKQKQSYTMHILKILFRIDLVNGVKCFLKFVKNAKIRKAIGRGKRGS